MRVFSEMNKKTDRKITDIIINNKMGKRVRRNDSEVFIRKSTQNFKTKPIESKRKRVLSQNALEEAKLRECYEIGMHLKQVLNNLTKESQSFKDTRLASIIGIISQEEIICSIQNIPSIENLISQNHLKSRNEFDSLGSCFSFEENPSYLLIDDEPQILLNYLIILERAFHKMPVKLSSKQNQLAIKGLWNLCLKFWDELSDAEIYEGITLEIELGLFQLLNFNLFVSNRQRVLMRQKLTELRSSTDA